ncbi:MAG: hypothetical protein ABIS01_04445, partial [Ferruginibacter sp.]
SDLAAGNKNDKIVEIEAPGTKEVVPLQNNPTVITQTELIKDALQNNPLLEDTIAKTQMAVSKKDAATKLPVPGKSGNKWKLGLAFSGGITATQDSYLGVIGLGNADELKAFAVPSQSTGGTGGSTIPFTSSKLTPGFGYRFGIYLQKNISYQTSILIGLNYKRYASAIVVGNPVNNSSGLNDIMYSTGNTSNYRNHFDFIELPISASLNLRKKNKLPIYLNAGLSIVQLLGSNALQFDTLSGAYFKNNAAFNKTLVSISAGFLFTLPLHSGNPISIGPDFNLSLGKMADAGLYKNRRYSYFGIRAQKIITGFGKK